MWTPPMVFAVIFSTISLLFAAMPIGIRVPIEQWSNSSNTSSGPPYPLNGSRSKRVELDLSRHRSPWKTSITKPSSKSICKRSEARHYPPLLWTDARIPFSLETNFNIDDLQNLRQAMDIIETYTSIKFYEANSSDRDYVRIVDNRRCSSELGRVGDGQQLSLAVSCRTVPKILHELCHVIGLIHEHSRPDRDDHIVVNMSNILHNYLNDFEKYVWAESYISGIRYDYLSIMHYGPNTASNGKRVITTKDPRYQDKIGKQTTLSFRDVKHMKILYPGSERSKCPVIPCPGEGFVGKGCLCWCPSSNISTPAVHCHGPESLLYVEDMFKEELNMSTNTENLESRLTRWITGTGPPTSKLQINKDLRNITVQFIYSRDSDLKNLISLSNTIDNLNKYTCVPVYGQIHYENGSIEVLNASYFSSFVKRMVKRIGGDKLLTVVDKCVTAMSDGFAVNLTADCTGLREALGLQESFLRRIEPHLPANVNTTLFGFYMALVIMLLLYLILRVIVDEQSMRLTCGERDNTTPVPVDDGTSDESSEVGLSSIVCKRDTLSGEEAEHERLMHDECDNKTPVQACDGTPDGSSEVGRSSIIGKGDTLSANEAEHEPLMHVERQKTPVPVDDGTSEKSSEVGPSLIVCKRDTLSGEEAEHETNDAGIARKNLHGCWKARRRPVKFLEIPIVFLFGLAPLFHPYGAIAIYLLGLVLLIIHILQTLGHKISSPSWQPIHQRPSVTDMMTDMRPIFVRCDDQKSHCMRICPWIVHMLFIVMISLSIRYTIFNMFYTPRYSSLVETDKWSFRGITGFNFSFDGLREVNMMYQCADRDNCSQLIECPGEAFIGKGCECWCRSTYNHLPVVLCG